MKPLNEFLNESMKANVKLLGKDAYLDDSKPNSKDWTVTTLERNSAMPKGKTVPFIQVISLLKVDGQNITTHPDYKDKIFN